MTFWVVLWQIVLIGALLVFAGLAIIVAVGGAVDLKKLFRHLSESQKSDGEEM